MRVPGKHVVRLTFQGEIEGAPKIDDESNEFGWFTLEELKKFSKEELDIYFKELLDLDKFSV